MLLMLLITLFNSSAEWTDKVMLDSTISSLEVMEMDSMLKFKRLEISFTKHHTYFNEKVNEIAKLPRATYMPGKTKFLPEGSKKTQT